MKDLALAYDTIRVLALRGNDVISMLLNEQEPISVNDLVRKMRKQRIIEQPDVSKFLRDCRDVGLVLCEQKGKNVYYVANRELIIRCIELSKNI